MEDVTKDLPPVRYGVIAAGRMAGQTMLKIMANHPAARPVAYYELDPTREDTAARIEQLRQRGIHACPTFEELLTHRDVDVILNITPHYAHADLSIQALDAGWPVVCEKPPACSRSECQAMVAAAGRSPRPLMIHFQHLLRPSARWLNQAICQGRLGRIRRVSCLSLWWRTDDYYRRVAWAGRRTFQGRPVLDGTMVNQSVHYLNQMLALGQRTGESHVGQADPGSVRAALYRFRPGDVLEMEDTAVVAGTLANDDRTEFVFAATTCAPASSGADRLSEYAGLADKHQVVIEGERGRAIWNGRASLEVDGKPPEIHAPSESHWPFYFHVRDVLAGRQQPVTPVAESVKTMDFIFSAYEAGGPIRQRPWDAVPQVPEAMARCVREFRLPGELDDPPAWA